MTGPTLPAGNGTWAEALDARLLRRLLGRRPRLSPAVRRGLDRLALGERRVPVSRRLGRRAQVSEEEPAGPALTVVHGIGQTAHDPSPAPVVGQPGQRADGYPPHSRPEAGHAQRAPAPPGPEPAPTSTVRPQGDRGPHRLPVVPAGTTGRGAAGAAESSRRATAGAPVARRTSARDGYLGAETRGRAAGASQPVRAIPGTPPAGAGSPVSPAPPPRVRPVPRDPARSVASQVQAPGRGARSLSVAARAVVQPRPSATTGTTGTAHPGPAPAPLPWAGGPGAGAVRAGAPPAAPPPAPPAAGGGVVQPLRAAATEPRSEVAGPAVDDVVDQVLRRLGREFAVSAERRGLRGGERGGELGR